MTKQELFAYIDERSAIFTGLSDQIWSFAELSLKEFQSMALYVELLKEEGFTVETGLCGVPTAFSGSFGSGGPVIGLLGEFDALSGLSQEAGIAERKELIKNGAGHGCGHNLLGAGALAAAFAVKDYLQKTKKPGTVVFYGCPGEEGGAGKAFMARDGLWKQIDAALTWHPGDVNSITTGTNNSSIQVEYKFTGVASHAAGAPESGRSALDAVELMNIGVQFLREHMADHARVHYAITDAGGDSANVVQPRARVLYMVRSTQVKEALALLGRVDKIAEAAAMMTETRMERRFIDGTANTISNFTLEKLLFDNLTLVGAPNYTKEEEDFAQALIATIENAKSGLPGKGLIDGSEVTEEVRRLSNDGQKPINDFIVPYFQSTRQSMGSTDVGDVSWLTPTAQFVTACFASKSPGHSWQQVACGKSSIAHKGLLTAGKVLAAAAIDLFEDEELLKKAKAEFALNAREGYTCPIPPGAKPLAIDEEF
ncbi:MAG: amidohydrolase [Christensenellaceae bacterium]|jgi:aminobenzoyl-glutamate utilization protein B|nr:amidohydrolase [Christensenellaceae bacterium]